MVVGFIHTLEAQALASNPVMLLAASIRFDDVDSGTRRNEAENTGDLKLPIKLRWSFDGFVTFWVYHCDGAVCRPFKNR